LSILILHHWKIYCNLKSTTTDHQEVEQFEDQRNVGEGSCNFGDGTEERVQSLKFIIIIIIIIIILILHVTSNR